MFLGDVFHGLSTSISTSFRYQQILRAIFPQIDVYITHVIIKVPRHPPIITKIAPKVCLQNITAWKFLTFISHRQNRTRVTQIPGAPQTPETPRPDLAHCGGFSFPPEVINDNSNFFKYLKSLKMNLNCIKIVHLGWRKLKFTQPQMAENVLKWSTMVKVFLI